MLIPLTRKTFEELLPSTATGEQYRYCWGKPADVLRRVLISVVGVLVAFIMRALLPPGFEVIEFLLGITTGFYWLWGPVYWASRRNREFRRYKYAGFWQGEVLDIFVTEDLIGTEETVNKQGELVIVENRERRLNLEVGDENGFTNRVQVPLQRSYKVIRPGNLAQMLVLSNRDDLSRIAQGTDLYLPDHELWVSDYPYLRRDRFLEVSRQVERRLEQQESEQRERSNRRPRRSAEEGLERRSGQRSGRRSPRQSRMP